MKAHHLFKTALVCITFVFVMIIAALDVKYKASASEAVIDDSKFVTMPAHSYRYRHWHKRDRYCRYYYDEYGYRYKKCHYYRPYRYRHHYPYYWPHRYYRHYHYKKHRHYRKHRHHRRYHKDRYHRKYHYRKHHRDHKRYHKQKRKYRERGPR